VSEQHSTPNETGRIEAFSDGVFAIAITLLILEIRVPPQTADGVLRDALRDLWPSYLAFLASFMTIGVMWLNHHRLFSLINKKDDGLIALNLLLLLGITWLPFPTALLAEHLLGSHSDQQAAAIIYAGSFLALAIVFNVMWRYAMRRKIVGEELKAAAISRQYALGPIMYAVLVAVAFFSAEWCLALSIFYGLYFALPPSLWTRRASTAALIISALLSAGSAARGQAVPAGNAQPTASTAFAYTGLLTGNIAGGVRRGATFGGAVAAQLTLLLNRMAGWTGAQVFVFVLDTHGGAPTNLVGAVQAVSGIEAPPAVRLEEIWVQQNLFENRLSLLAGRYDVNTEFYRLQSTALFVQSSFGIGPEFAQSGVAGPSTFPFTAVGARIDFKPSPNVVWRAAVLNGAPVDRPGGQARVFARGDGALMVGELALLDRPDTANVPRDRRFMIGRGPARTYTRKVALGAWYYTARFPI
jgi:uncharacterized membrane protein